MFYYLLDIFWLIIFIKIFLFWLWLWQLKEYHIGRFIAHFETQKIKKFISSFWRIKYPKFTKKIIIIFFVGCGLAISWLVYFPGILLIILVPIFSSLLILFFEIPTVIWRNSILQKATEKRAKFNNLLVIGIVGSYGKTSTKEFLVTILGTKVYPVKSAKGGAEQFNRVKILKTKENHNSEIGISRCILQELKPEHQIFICEMAAYNKGGIKLLSDIVQPKIGIVTGVNEQHLSTFGSMENLLSAEGGEELVNSLPENGIVFLNGNNKYCRELYEKISIKKFLYGQDVKIAGMENIEGAKLVAREIGGMSDLEIEQAVEKIENKFPGIEIKKGTKGLTIINATYSANPTGVMAHLDYLKTPTFFKKVGGKKIIIMPCLIELGSESKRIHQEIGKKIAEVCDLSIIITKDRFQEIKQGAPNALFIENPKKVLKKIKEFVKENDVILLEGRLSKQLVYLIEKM